MKFLEMMTSFLSLPDMLFFNYDTVYQDYDDISFGEWAICKRVSRTFYDIILEPILSITLNVRETFSAAELLSYMQIYFLTDSKSDYREVAKVNFYEAFLGPWEDHLVKNNVK